MKDVLNFTDSKFSSQFCARAKPECRFLSRVEGNMSRVEVECKKKVFSCGLYLLGQDSLIFLVFT